MGTPSRPSSSSRSPRALPRFGAGGRVRRMLMQGEQPEAWAKGKNTSILVATDRRVILVRRGWIYGRYTTTSFGYPQITSVERFNNAFGTFIQINAAGVPGRQVANTFPISAFGAGDAAETVAAIQAHLYAPAGTLQGQQSIPQQIAELAHLRDIQAISQAEYEQKKNELLGRM